MIFTRLRQRLASLFFPLLLLSGPLLGGAALAQETPPPTEAPDPPGVEENVSALDLYRQGGGFMHVLLVCSIGTIAVSVYCFIQISRKKMAPPSLVDPVNAAMASHDVVAAYNICQGNPASYARVMTGALLKVNFERDLANKASMIDAAALETA